MTGRQIGPYTILEPLGAGGMGEVYRARDMRLALRPENVFITKDEQVKILDFGLAKLARPDAGSDTQELATMAGETGDVMGTVEYMAPEQIRGQAADHRADIFAFGAILFEMTTGRRAFSGASALETMQAIPPGEAPAPASDTAQLPALGLIVRRCLEKNPDARFRSARDLGDALQAASGGGMTGPSPTSRGRWRARLGWR